MILALLLLLQLLGPNPVLGAQVASIHDIALINTEHGLLLFFELRNIFTPELEAGVMNGIPASFIFTARLGPADPKRAEEVIRSKTFEHTITYDTLKDEYRVRCTEKGEEVMVVKDFGTAKQLASEVNGALLVDLATLVKGNDYLVRVKASLTRNTLPLNVHNLIPFWKPWDVETDWHATSFRFAAPSP